jgi:hypothetical protein
MAHSETEGKYLNTKRVPFEDPLEGVSKSTEFLQFQDILQLMVRLLVVPRVYPR